MIAHVRGQVAQVSLTSAVVEVGGVGLALLCTPATLATLRTGSEATLAATLVVREDSLTLFGFANAEEKQMFELLQTASGIGPKVAQAVLAVMSPDDVRRALGSGDVKALTRVPGIGPKGAQKMILELKDKVGVLALTSGGTGPVTGADQLWRGQVSDGLVGLGWSLKEAEKAVDLVAPEAGESPDVGALLRAALRTLSKA